MSDADTLILSVFDNGDGRGLEQPALAEEKYTRGVIYKIDQKKMTVQQLWEVGKDLGHEYLHGRQELRRSVLFHRWSARPVRRSQR